ncbi:glycosyltransferase family 9 protein [Aeromonas hydrophila]|uniref:glycosyltransferase family 9 protein n=1 Tax=Aeromonas hydrophila TaxID=644 RepID=UPI003EC90008
MGSYLIILNCSYNKPHVIDQLLSTWPREWDYWITPTGLESYISDFLYHEFNTGCQVCSIDNLSRDLLIAAESYDFIIVCSDDGAIVLPQDSELEALSNMPNTIGIFHPGSIRYDKRKLYSIDDYDTPDNYLASAIIPGRFANFYIESIVESNNRWLAHLVALQAIEGSMQIYVMRQQKSVFPNPWQISGIHVSKNRILVAYLFEKFEQMLSKMISSPQPLLNMINSYKISGNLSLEQKDEIDSYLSIMTAMILNMGNFSQVIPAPIIRDLRGKNVVIFKVECIGDVITTTPFFESVLSSGARNVFLVTTEAMRSIFEHDDRYSGIVYLPTEHKRSRFNHEHGHVLAEDLDRIKNNLPNCDIALFPRYCIDTNVSRFLAVLLNIPVRIGFQSEPFCHRYNLLYDQMLTDCLSPPFEVHETARMLWFIEQLGLESKKFSCLKLPFVKQNASRQQRFVIGLGAASPDRRWPKESYSKLINKLSHYYPTYEFLLLGGKDVVDDAIYVEETTNSINLVGSLSLFESAKIISESELYIGNDSGLMHISAAAKTPVVEISKHPIGGYIWHANSPKRFGPWGVPFISIQPEYGLDSCSDCCQASDVHCIGLINVDSVIRKVLTFFEYLRSNNQ